MAKVNLYSRPHNLGWYLPKKNYSFWARVVLLSAIPLVGVSFVAYATANGIGISPDSVHYLGTARNILNSNDIITYTKAPLTHFPPLFPIVIALVSSLGINTIDAALLLNIIISGATVASIIFITYFEINGSFKIAALAGIFTITAIPILHIHSWVWSEPLFIFLSVWGLFFLQFISTHRSAFILSALCVGLACITRYAGIALIIAGAASILIMDRRELFLRVKRAIIWSCVSGLFLAGWMLRNVYVEGSTTNREIDYHPLSPSKTLDGIKTLLQWILPGARSVVVIGFVAAVALIVWLASRHRNPVLQFLRQSSNFVRLLVVYIFVYPLFLVFSISFADAHTPLDSRILSVLFPPFVIVLASLFSQLNLEPELRRRFQRQVVNVPIYLFVILHMVTALNWLDQRHTDGTGYNSSAWKKSQTIAFLQGLPEELLVFSNAPDAVYILTNRHSRSIPPKWNPGTLEVNPEYGAQLDTMVEALREGGVLIFFDLTHRDYQPTESELLENVRLTLIAETSDGTIYTVR